MGKHSGAPSAGPSVGFLVIAGAVALALVAALAWGMTRAGEDGSPADVVAATATTSGAGDRTTPSSDGTTSGRQASSAATVSGPSASSTPAASTSVPPGLAACRDQVSALAAVARAGARTASEWREHVDAQLRLDTRQNTLAQTMAVWEASHGSGPAQVRTFRSAVQRADDHKSGCADVVAATAGTPDARLGRTCRARSKALLAVAREAGTVTDQWAAHLAMAGQREGTSDIDYHYAWLRQVRDARPALAAYDRATAALERAPSCQSG